MAARAMRIATTSSISIRVTPRRRRRRAMGGPPGPGALLLGVGADHLAGVLVGREHVRRALLVVPDLVRLLPRVDELGRVVPVHVLEDLLEGLRLLGVGVPDDVRL